MHPHSSMPPPHGSTHQPNYSTMSPSRGPPRRMAPRIEAPQNPMSQLYAMNVGQQSHMGRLEMQLADLERRFASLENRVRSLETDNEALWKKHSNLSSATINRLQVLEQNTTARIQNSTVQFSDTRLHEVVKSNGQKVSYYPKTRKEFEGIDYSDVKGLLREYGLNVPETGAKEKLRCHLGLSKTSA